MIYQHAITVEDRAIAARLSGLVDAHRAEPEDVDGADFLGKDDESDDGSASVPVR